MKNSTDITVVLDRSGSMAAIRTDTIGGYNTFLKDQQDQPGEARISLMQFDDKFEPNYTGIPIAEAKPLTPETFRPRGWTALLDAVGKTIVDTGERLSSIPEADRPDKVIFVIITDGQENSSKEYTRAKVLEMIRTQTDVYKWQFLFLAANQDAIAEGAKLGVAVQNAVSFAHNAKGSSAVLRATSAVVSNYRSTGQNVGYSQSDRDEQKAAGASH